MTLRSIRPVGNRIVTGGDASPRFVDDLFAGYEVDYLSSGTAALALAIRMACAARRVEKPEVILPAYGCPDLVAAAVHAGARPVLADLSRESVEYAPESIAALLSPRTVAIVAVTFLGIRANAESLRAAIADRGIVLVEDSAQWFPRTPSQRFFGDYVVLSFGRGKPVNLLGGGALLTARHMESAAKIAPQAHASQLADAFKVTLYNVLIRPGVYGIAEKLPFLQIGLTEYHELREIGGMPSGPRRRLRANVRLYRERSLNVQDRWREAFREAAPAVVIDLPRTHGVPADCALLRYPILVRSRSRRDELYTQMRKFGLGASTLYTRALPDIEGVSAHVSTNEIPCARDFADRLLTLPTHEDVDEAMIRRTVELIGP